MWVFVLGPFCVVVLDVLSILAIILLRKRELVVLLCDVDACALCLFFTVSMVGLWSGIMAFPGHNH